MAPGTKEVTMTTSEQSQVRTRMFARVLGPYLTIVPTTVAVRGSYMQTLFTEFKANPMWPWLFGAILLSMGVLIIAFHQCWRSPAAVIVSVVGWAAAVRGVLLLTVPQAYNAAGNALVGPGAVAAVRIFFVCLGLVGLYLAYVGWRPERRRPESVASPGEDRSHAASD
jgi:hypothetical protein